MAGQELPAPGLQHPSHPWGTYHPWGPGLSISELGSQKHQNNLPKRAPSQHLLVTGQSPFQHREGETSPKLFKYLLLQP